MRLPRWTLVLLAVIVAPAAQAATFAQDVAFLRKHVEVLVLGEGDARVLVVPAWQGRVVTSTAAGDGGGSFGWINRALVESGKKQAHINPYGGEDRLWLGPEGGQFSIFFRAGDPYDLDHWQTPAVIDTDPWKVVDRDAQHVRFTHAVEIANRAGTSFSLKIERTIRLIGPDEIFATCQLPPGAGKGAGPTRLVGFQTENRLTNAGKTPWTRAGGLLSLWSMGMFAPSPTTTVVVPLSPAARGKAGVVNDAYFGKVPADRLVVKNNAVFFRADGQQRGKIGLRPSHARATLGSYDVASQTLTLVAYRPPGGKEPHPYVNSLWQDQKDPFAGDVVNSYNDGPPAPGKPALGPFYELETSSPGAELAPGAWLDHRHRTFHVQGDRAVLDRVARACLGVSVAEIEAAFTGKGR